MQAEEASLSERAGGYTLSFVLASEGVAEVNGNAGMQLQGEKWRPEMENEAAELELPVNPAQARMLLAFWGAPNPIGGQLCGPKSCDAGGAVSSLLSQSTTV